MKVANISIPDNRIELWENFSKSLQNRSAKILDLIADHAVDSEPNPYPQIPAIEALETEIGKEQTIKFLQGTTNEEFKRIQALYNSYVILLNNEYKRRY